MVAVLEVKFLDGLENTEAVDASIAKAPGGKRYAPRLIGLALVVLGTSAVIQGVYAVLASDQFNPWDMGVLASLEHRTARWVQIFCGLGFLAAGIKIYGQHWTVRAASSNAFSSARKLTRLRPKFSLRTLLCTALFAGSTLALLHRSTPWASVNSFQMPAGSGVSQALFADKGNFIVMRSDATSSGNDVVALDSWSGRKVAAQSYGFSSQVYKTPVLASLFNISSDGQKSCAVYQDGSIHVAEIRTGRTLIELRGHTAEADAVSFSPDGKYIASSSHDNTTRIWNLEDKGSSIALTAHSNNIFISSFSEDSKYLLTASQLNCASVWSVETGAKICEMKGHVKGIVSALFSPDGRKAVTASNDGTARVWDARDGRQLAVLDDNGVFLTSASFSPDGTKIVTTDGVGRVQIWDAATYKLRTAMTTELCAFEYANYAKFFPDGARLMTLSSEGKVYILDVERGVELAKLGAKKVTSADISPDGQRILTVGESSARIWKRLHDESSSFYAFPEFWVAILFCMVWIGSLWRDISGYKRMERI